MARVSKVDACMFCGKVPCDCNSVSKTQSKKTVGRKIETVAAPALEPKKSPSMLDAMRKAAVDAPALNLNDKRTYPKVIKPVIEETPIIDLLLADALRNLASILHPDELEKYKMQITSQPTQAERARVWRARRYG